MWLSWAVFGKRDPGDPCVGERIWPHLLCRRGPWGEAGSLGSFAYSAFAKCLLCMASVLGTSTAAQVHGEKQQGCKSLNHQPVSVLPAQSTLKAQTRRRGCSMTRTQVTHGVRMVGGGFRASSPKFCTTTVFLSSVATPEPRKAWIDGADVP